MAYESPEMMKTVCTCWHIQIFHDEVAGRNILPDRLEDTLTLPEEERPLFTNEPVDMWDGKSSRIRPNMVRGVHSGHCTVLGCPCTIFTWAGFTDMKPLIKPLGADQVRPHKIIERVIWSK